MKTLIVRLMAAALCSIVFCSCAAQGGAESVRAPQEKKVRVGLYVDSGASGNGLFHLASLIEHSPQTELVTLLASDIRAGKLKEVDILVMPGGGSTAQCMTIGLEHHDKIRDFLRNGGGYVGTCAGMFNVLQIPKRLHLLPFGRHGGAGGSTSYVTVNITPEGAKILGIKPGLRNVRYSGGPVAYALKDAKCEGKGIALATFKDAVCKRPHHVGKFMGSVACVYGTFGKGKVIATSFHPEYTVDAHDMMLGCFYAVNGVRMTPVFPKKNSRPWRVGVLSLGLTGHTPVRTMLDLEKHPDIDVDYVMMAELNKWIMKHLDYLVMLHGNRKVLRQYIGKPFVQEQFKTFMERGGVILASGNAAEVVPSHKNFKKLPEKADFKKYILK